MLMCRNTPFPALPQCNLLPNWSLQHLCTLPSTCERSQFFESADPARLIWGNEVATDYDIGALGQDSTEVCLL